MESPRRFTYGPHWTLILGCFVAGTALVALASVHAISIGVVVVLSVFPFGMALVGGLRRLIFPRFIELGPDLSICSGFFQARTTHIPYTGIEDTWEVVRPGMAVLYVRTGERIFEVSSRLLPDMTSYVAVRDFVQSHVTSREKTPPGEGQPGERGKYCFKCSYEGDGEIYDWNGKTLWRTKTEHLDGQPRYPFGLFQLPDFVVCDTADKELFRVTRQRKWPLTESVLAENGSLVCTIRQRSILLNSYTLDFTNGQEWKFRMPLFTVMFRGSSGTGDAVRVRLWTHNVWYVAIDSKADNPRLVAALAFIHRERLRCN